MFSYAYGASTAPLLGLTIGDNLKATAARFFRTRSLAAAAIRAGRQSRLTLGEAFKASEVAGILLIGGGLVLLSLLSWAASRRNPGAHRDLAGEKQ